MSDLIQVEVLPQMADVCGAEEDRVVLEIDSYSEQAREPHPRGLGFSLFDRKTFGYRFVSKFGALSRLTADGEGSWICARDRPQCAVKVKGSVPIWAVWSCRDDLYESLMGIGSFLD